MNNTLVIYDADPDGFGSAWAAWNRFGDNADYIEVLHGTDAPEEAFKAYDSVYVLDLSFSEYTYLSIMHTSKLTVIDHHPSAKDTIEKFGLNPIPFDTTTAACEQVWRHFFPFEDVPMILRYVGDRDTWAWEMPQSDEVNSYISTVPEDFDYWTQANFNIENDFNHVWRIGEGIVNYREHLVDELVEDATLVEGWHEKKVPFVAAPVLHSEVGHALLEIYPGAPFSLTYQDKKGYRKYSLRSEDHREDVGAYASARGGGGHHNAAGFSRPLADIWKEGYENLHKL